ncbi:glutathione S-transferase theta-3-like [Spea bombifrons]|uniref:glutathione S-transferase theta-3-like n=1 Tax=Spea bombifrons TaxID=233779 RepID=UPI00234B1F6E|nr:glutathione S-transferase theta-3-like [Spea bombifrons]
MAELSLYLDLLSQPCRSVYIFAKANNIPFQFAEVRLSKGEQLGEDFAKVNAFCKVPALKDGDFTLSESIAILLYLARKFNTPDHWYPSDLQKRARVDEYLAWQHTNTRLHCYKVFWAKHMSIILGQEVSSEKLDCVITEFNTTVTNLEKVFLADKPFLVGEEISVADLVALVEIMQAVAGGLDVFEDRPKLAAWKQRVVEAVGEELFNEAHAQILNVKEQNEAIAPEIVEALKAKLVL